MMHHHETLLRIAHATVRDRRRAADRAAQAHAAARTPARDPLSFLQSALRRLAVGRRVERPRGTDRTVARCEACT